MPDTSPPNGSANHAQPSSPMLNGATSYPGDEPSDGVSQMRQLLSQLWQGKWIIWAVLVVVVGAVGIYTYQLPPVYQTSSLLMVEPKQNNASFSLNLGAGTGAAQQQKGMLLASEIFVIQQSDELAMRAARHLIEKREAAGTGGGGEGRQRLNLLYGPDGEILSPEQLAPRLRSRVSVQPVSNSVGALRIFGTGNDAQEAAFIANTYAEAYVIHNRERSRADSRSFRRFLEQQTARLRSRLDSLGGLLVNFKKEAGATAMTQEAGRAVQQIAQLEAQRDQTQIQLDMKQAALRKQEEQLEQIEPKLAARAASGLEAQLRQVQKQKTKLQMQLDQIYNENPGIRENPNSRVRQMRQRLENLRGQVQTLSQQYINETLAVGGINPLPSGGAGEGGGGGAGLSYIANQREEMAQLRIEISGLQAKLRTINQSINEYQWKQEQIPSQSMQLAKMQRSRETTERLYTQITSRLQQARLAEQSKMGNAGIVRPAPVPGVPIGPDKQRNLVLGAFLGLFLGGGLVLLRSRVDTRLHRPEDLRRWNHDLLGVIPDMKPLIKENFGGKDTVTTVDDRKLSTALPMLLSPSSAPAEAYRRLRTNLQFSRSDTVVQTLLVTSADKDEGKSTTALNIALSMAQAGRRTLVVDLDLRNPQMHRMLDLPRTPGLAEVLSEEVLLENAFHPTGVDNCYALSAGGTVSNPAELIGSRRMRMLIEQMRQSFDLVVFDTSPALTFSDAALLSTQCDGTLLVAKSGGTDRRAYGHAVKTLEDVGAKILGSVLNRFDARQPGLYDYVYTHQYQRMHEYYSEEKERQAEAAESGEKVS